MGTEHDEQLAAIAATLLAIADDNRVMKAHLADIKAETAGTSKAFHDINQRLAVIAANSDLAAEQLIPLGTQLAELEKRMVRLERRRVSTIPPPVTEDDT
jgi:hypothetical protein